MFTTGEAAAVCRVSQQTIIRCFDNGKLTGFRVPGSRFRRIPRDELIRFMRAHGMSTAALEPGGVRVLVIDEAPAAERLAGALSRDPRLRVSWAGTLFDAGYAAAQMRGGVVVVASRVAGSEGVCARVSSGAVGDRARVIVLMEPGHVKQAGAFKQAGADEVLPRETEVSGLVERCLSVAGATGRAKER